MPDHIEFAGKSWQRRSGCGWSIQFDPEQATIGSFSVSSTLYVRTYDEADIEQDDREAPPPSQEQNAAIGFFLGNQPAIYDEILRQLLRFCQQRHQEDPFFFDCLDGVNSIEQLQPLVGQFDISIERDAADGFAWVALSGNCDWEVEHGTGICLWKDIVLEVGTHDTLMQGPTNAFRMLPPLADADREATRVHVVEVLEAAAVAKAEAAEADFQARLPDPVRLQGAILTGDTVQVDELVSRDVSLKDYPAEYGSPLTSAVCCCNAVAVEQMLKHGARPGCKGPEGETPLKTAKQMLKTLQMSQQLQQQVMGDLSSMLAGQSPQTGGLMSMLGDLQDAAANMLTELDGNEYVPPARNEAQIAAKQKELQQTADETTNNLLSLKRIIDLLQEGP